MYVQDFAKLELMVAAQGANINHKAIVNNQPLHIDRYLDSGSWVDSLILQVICGWPE